MEYTRIGCSRLWLETGLRLVESPLSWPWNRALPDPRRPADIYRRRLRKQKEGGVKLTRNFIRHLP
jgi:hypothetical protein